MQVILQVISYGNVPQHSELVFAKVFDSGQYFLNVEVDSFIILYCIKKLFTESPMLIIWQLFTLADKFLVLANWINQLVAEQLHQVWYIGCHNGFYTALLDEVLIFKEM